MPSIVATPEPGSGRVRIDVMGGRPGEPVYVFRRDSGGVVAVRDTSEGTVLWPPFSEVNRRNRIVNPEPADTVDGWSSGARTSLAIVPEADGTALELSSSGVDATLTLGPSVAGDAQWSPLPVQVGRQVRYVTRVKALRNTSVRVRLQGVDGAGANTETVATSTLTIGPGDGYRDVDITGTVMQAATTGVRVLYEVIETRNLLPDPSFEGIGGWSAEGTITAVTTRDADAVVDGVQALRLTVGTAPTGTEWVSKQVAPADMPAVGQWLGFTAAVRAVSVPLFARVRITFLSAAGAAVGSPVVTTAAISTTGHTRIAAVAQIPSGATAARMSVGPVSSEAGVAPAAGQTITTDAWIAAAGASPAAATTAAAAYRAPTLGPILRVRKSMLLDSGSSAVLVGGYFTGASPSTEEWVYGWDGAANMSESIEGATEPITLYDYEPAQGVATDYLLTDRDGGLIASTRVTVPLWGTWLKSPGRPFRNTRLYFGKVEEVLRPARREVYDIENAGQVVVYAARRGGKRAATLELITRTEQQRAALDRLLADGATLMLDTPPSWDVPFRYFSAGDVTETRPLSTSDGYGNLGADARLWSFADVVAQAAPLGVTVIDPGRTYEVLPTLFSTYVAIPATTATYEQLATGEGAI